MKRKWWHDTIGYQIYPKSFLDTNGDGIGDIPGIIEKLDYFEELGINVIWVCPVYQSPMMDHGYDISDYTKIDPSFGTNDDIVTLIKEADKRGIKILMDLVINHTSDEHEWFKEAMKDLDGKYAKYYIIREGVNGQPPNNWRSMFGGSAWEKIGNTNKYYLHLFTKGQPDLNWENEELREVLYKMVNDWMEMGLGGFRIDAISHLKKDFSYVNLPPDGADNLITGRKYYRNVQGLEVFLKELKERTFKIYDSFTIGEIDDVKPESLEEYIGDDGYFSTIFDFSHRLFRVRENQWADKPIEMVNAVRDTLFERQNYAKGHGLLCNFLENHDMPRIVNRVIPEKYINFYSQSLVAVVTFFLRGIPFLYQGQEIGMRDFPKKSINEFKDPTTYKKFEEFMINDGLTNEEALNKLNIESREHSRTPVQWSDEENAGFTKGTPWFAVNPNYKEINFKKQENDPNSLLSFYKKMIAVRKRKDLIETFIYGETIPRYLDKAGIIAYERRFEGQKIIVINNCKSDEVTLELSETVKEVILNNYQELEIKGNSIKFKPFQTVIIEISK